METGLCEGENGPQIQYQGVGCICYNCVGTLTKVESNVNANKYISILEDNI